MLKSDLSHSE